MLYSGIDLHRRSITICTVDEHGTALMKMDFKNNPKDIVHYFRQSVY